MNKKCKPNPCIPNANHIPLARVGARVGARVEAILKKTSVSGVAAGWFKKVRIGTFFLIFAKKNIFFKNGHFPTNKKY